MPDLSRDAAAAVAERETVWVKRLENVQCTVNVGNRFAFITDEPVEIGGSGMAVNPFAMLLASLGTCSVGTLTGYARANGIPLDGVSLKLTRKLNTVSSTGPGDPRELELKIVRIDREITVEGALSEADLDRLRAAVACCPVANSLKGSIPIRDTLRLAGH